MRKPHQFLLLFFLLVISCPAMLSQNCKHKYKGTIVLTKSNPTVEKSDVFTAPGMNFQCYTVYNIDLSSFSGKGILKIKIKIDERGCPGSFDLFPGGFPLPTEGRPEGSLAGDYDVMPDFPNGKIEYEFEGGQIFQFCATGSFFAEKGMTNDYSFTATLVYKYDHKNIGSITLSPGNPLGKGSGSLIAPGANSQAYSLTSIDTRAFKNGGTLKIYIQLGSGESGASFDLYPDGVPIPTEGTPEGSLAGTYNIYPGSECYIEYKFDKGKVFNFGATGSWSSEQGSENTYSFRVEVERK